MRYVATLILLMCGLLLSACGYKAPPKPLLKPLPNAVETLRVRQLGDANLISWGAPQRNQDGSTIDDLDHYALYRMSYDPADECPECRDTSILLRKVDPMFLKDAQFEAGRYALLDRQGLKSDLGYQYRLQAMTTDGYSGTPSKLRQVFFEAPQPPTMLQGQSLERLIRLSWQAVDTSSGMTLLGYHIYRGKGEAPLSLQSVNAKPEQSTGYDDFAISGGQSYRYAVRAVWQKDGIELETGLSDIVSVLAISGR